MLSSITFQKDYRGFVKGEFLKFHDGINLLVGEQGCGKSTLINLICESKKYADPLGSDYVYDYKTQNNARMPLWKYDFEKDNPRMQHHIGKAVGFQVSSHFASHGQTVRAILYQFGNIKDENGLFLMDEPDMALSIRSCYAFIKDMEAQAARGCQIIAAVHNPILITSQEEVLSLEHRRWMPAMEFVQSHHPDTQGKA